MLMNFLFRRRELARGHGFTLIRDPDDDFACGLTVVFDGEREVAVTGSALDVKRCDLQRCHGGWRIGAPETSVDGDGTAFPEDPSENIRVDFPA
jgi:hypothetical protein